MPRWSGSRRSRITAGALLGALLAAACTNTPSEPDPTAAPSPTSSVPPEPSGTVTVAIPSEPATLDPFAPGGGAPATRDLTRLMMPALWREDGSGARAPWLLAAEPEIVEATTIRITLRDDAVWSDGKPIVIADLEHTRAHAVANAVDGYDAIVSIEQETPKRALIVFTRRAPTPLTLFSAGLGVLPAHVPVEQLARTWPVSGGPFLLSAWRPGLDITLEPNMSAPDGPPTLERLRFVFVPDATGALELLRRGEVDVLGPYLAPDWSRRVGETEGVTVSRALGQTWAALVLDRRRGPFSDQRVRRALAHSIDRGRIARGLVGDEGALLDAAPPGGIGGYDIYGDLDQARTLLTRAGWTGSPRRRNGATLDPTVAFVGEDLTWIVVRAIQFQARQAGFDLQAVPLDTEQLWGDWLFGDEQRAALLVLRDPPGGVRARLGIGRTGAAARAEAIPLFAVAVILAASERVGGVCASASADGPYWNAHAWIAGAGSEAACPTLLPAAA